MKLNNSNNDILEGKPLQPKNEVLFSLVKKIVEESIQITRDYSKTMIQFSFGAIPVYITILKGLTSQNFFGRIKFFTVIPNLLFLLSAICFIISYLPKTADICINITEIFESTIKRTIRRRAIANLVGTIIFIIGVLLGSIIISFSVV